MLRSSRSSIGSRRTAEPRILALLIVALVGLAGCSGSAASTSVAGNGEQRAPAPAMPAPTAGPSIASNTTGGSVDGSVPGSGNDQLIVRTGSLALEVKDLDTTLLQARARIVGLGGYVSDSERANAGDQTTALITYRIPAARWDEALDALRGFATKVVGEQTRAVEVTGQVLDLGARIDNLRATERALQTIMTSATKISDILEVQNQLTNVQGEIEQLSTQKAHLSDQAALGTLAVTYTVPVVAVAHVSSGWSLGAEFDRAVAQLVQLGQGLAVAAVWLGVVGLPILFGLLLLAALVIFAARRLGLGRQAGTGSGMPAASA
jgi:hypothetical protein